MATVYLGRDNRIHLQLLQDGSVIKPDVVTKAALHVPGSAFSNGVGVTYDTTGPMLSLAENSTAVVVQLGGAPLRTGQHVCLLTVYDGISPDGLAWSELTILVQRWAA